MKQSCRRRGGGEERKKRERNIHNKYAQGEPVRPMSDSLAITELSSHSSGDGISDSGPQRLDD